jgi:hypothetical protein
MLAEDKAARGSDESIHLACDALEDIAKVSGIRYNMVSVRLNRVRKKLKKQLMKEGLLV